MGISEKYEASVKDPEVEGQKPTDAAAKSHHVLKTGTFVNPWNSFVAMDTSLVFKELTGRLFSGKPLLAGIPDHSGIPVVTPNFSSTRALASTLRATWLGHASSYLEFPSGLRALTDPVFEARCSPSQLIGPKRFTPAPCQVVDLPFVDLVVISHNHYDHLSAMTTRDIKKNFPEAWWFVPLGNKSWFSSMGIENCVEMDWWEEKELTLSHRKDSHSETFTGSDDGNGDIGEMKALIGCLPCQHQSGRGALDAGKSLWSSWSIESGGIKVWFGGDTGYRGIPKPSLGVNNYSSHLDLPHCPAFEEIGSLRGPFDLGLIPIGAYAPRSLSSSLHINPFESVSIFLDTRCEKAMAIHWGTWALGFEPTLEPKTLLKEALKQNNMPLEGVFDTYDIGETRTM